MITNYKTETIETKNLILRKGLSKDYEEIYGEMLEKIMFYEPNTFYTCSEQKHLYDWIVTTKEGVTLGNVVAKNMKNNGDRKTAQITYEFIEEKTNIETIVESVTAVIEHLYGIGYEKIIQEYNNGNKEFCIISDKLDFKVVKVAETNSPIIPTPIIDYVAEKPKDEWAGMSLVKTRSKNTPI